MAGDGLMPGEPPFFSQYGDIACCVAADTHPDISGMHDWRADGYLDGAAYSAWSHNICGLTCLQMILASDPDRRPRLTRGALAAQAVAWGVLVPQDDGAVTGLIYAPFVRWVESDFGLEAQSRPNLPLDEVCALVGSGEWYALLSVSYEIRTPAQPPTHRGGHLVLAWDADADGVTFHNPSGLWGTGRAVRLSWEQFEPFYAARGVIVRRHASLN